MDEKTSDDRSAEDFGFEIAHIGLNLPDGEAARTAASRFSDLFGLALRKDGASSLYAGNFLEFMKGAGRGAHGHIAVATDDIEGAKSWLESRGFEFAPESIKRDGQGKMIVIFLKDEIAGFAVHLLDKSELKERI